MNKKYFLFWAVFLVLAMLNSVFAAPSYSGQLQVSSGGGKIIISGPGQLPEHYCGNGIKESYIGEQCDGSDLGEATCISLGYDFGSLVCKSNCIYDTSLCGNNPPSSPIEGGEGGGGGGGGGGEGSSASSSSSASSCVESWQCSDWGVCKEGKQTRECEDISNCGTTLLKPALERECTVEGEEGEAGIGLNTGKTSQGILGAILGAGNAKYLAVLAILVLVLVLYFLVFMKKKK